MEHFKLSPSDLTFLWDECKRCFYLKIRSGFKRPGLPFPRIFGTIDLLMKDIYLGNSTHKISPDLPPGKAILAGRWVRSEPIHLPGFSSTCYIQGIYDTVVQLDDGSYGIVDFKTTTPKDSHVAFYGRQLNAYAYALQHPAPNKTKLAPVSIMGLLCFDPNGMDELPEDALALKGPLTWVEVPVDEAGFLEFLSGVMDVLDKPEPPEANPDCQFCAYRDAARGNGL